MKRVFLLVVVVMLATCGWGCRSIESNSQMLVADTTRFAGLDEASWLHPRVNVPQDYYTPYR